MLGNADRNHIYLAVGKTSMSTGTPSTTAQIGVRVVNGQLKVFGAQQLIKEGYVPYLFRQTRKRNPFRDKDTATSGILN